MLASLAVPGIPYHRLIQNRESPSNASTDDDVSTMPPFSPYMSDVSDDWEYLMDYQ